MRSWYGVARQAGKARLAAATARSTSAAFPTGKWPRMTRRSTGLWLGALCAPTTSAPSMCMAWNAPSPARSSARAASKRACISSGGSNMVE